VAYRPTFSPDYLYTMQDKDMDTTDNYWEAPYLQSLGVIADDLE